MQDDNPEPQELAWPEFSLRRAEYIISFIASIIGIISFSFPQIINSQWYKEYHTYGILLILPVFYYVFKWFIFLIGIIIKRIKYYPQLFDQCNQLNKTNQELNQGIVELQKNFPNRIMLDLIRASVIENKLYLSIGKNDKATLAEEDTITVIDIKDSMLMGVFDIIQIRQDDYYALGKENSVDPLWLGYIRERNSEVSIFPNLIAIYIPKGDQNGG